MKIIHTSDWHIGQNFHNYSRSDEHRCMGARLRDLVAKEQPDALLVSGDIFDVSNPTITAKDLWTRMMIDICSACKGMRAVVIAGNHDSAARLQVDAPLWRRIGVEIVTAPRMTADGLTDPDAQIIDINGKGYVVAVPYIPEYNYRRYAGCDENAMAVYHTRLFDRVAELNTGEKPVVMMAHLGVMEHDAARERTLQFSNCRLADLNLAFDYLALGHIHHPYTFTDGRSRYCGSPLALSFDESYRHSFTIVDIDGHGARPVITEYPIDGMPQVTTLPAEALELPELERYLAGLPDDCDDYLRVNLKVKSHIPSGARQTIENALRGKKYRFCYINPVREHKPAEIAVSGIETAEIRRMSPMEIAERFYAAKYPGNEIPEEMKKCLAEAIDRYNSQQRHEDIEIDG